MAKSVTVVFEKLPENIGELRALPQMEQQKPFEIAALTAAVMLRYDESPQDATEMMNVLRGSKYMTPYDMQLLRDRLSGKGYIARSYFAGAAPENGYQPDIPYSVTVFDDPNSYVDENFIKLNLRSSGADSPRQVQLKQRGGKWFLSENYLMGDIKEPAPAAENTET